MKHRSEGELALYAGNDLDTRTMLRMSEHIAECPACATAVADFEAANRSLASANAQPSTMDLLEVRQRVMVAINTRPRLPWWWAVPVGVALLLALTGMNSSWLRNADMIPPPPEFHARITEPLWPDLQVRKSVVPAEVPVPRHEGISAGIRKVSLIRDSDGETMIKLQTADPTVVILLAEERTASE
jgi:anti-sigma factor RsiW